MKRTLVLFSSALLLAIAGCSNEGDKPKEVTDTTPMTDTAAAKPAAAKPAEVDSATAMQRWQAYATPGDAHKAMAAMSGKWKTETTSWESPEKPPMKSTGMAEYKMILDGRFQQTSYKGNMMGMPFEGMGTMGYDNAKKKFTSTWVDNMTTGMMIMEGTWDDASKSYNLKGKMYDCVHETDADCREVVKMTDDKNMTMEMYCNGPDGKEMKMMEIKYTKM